MSLVIPEGKTVYRGGGKLRGAVPDAIAKQLEPELLEAINTKPKGRAKKPTPGTGPPSTK